MKKINLKKQTIFSLLGILVVVASIPMAILLVKQRQDIRKEAALPTCGQYCGQNGSAPYGPYCVCGSDSRDSSLEYKDCTTQTSDCGARNCCYGVKQKTQKPPPPPNEPPASSSITCGSWCGTKIGRSDNPYCVCGNDGKDTNNFDYNTCSATKDCSKCCVGTQKSTNNGTVDGNTNLENAYGKPVWGLYQTERTCSVAPPTATPTKPKNTPTPTPPKKICNQTCTNDSWCTSPLKCLDRDGIKYCLNQDCPEETDCACPTPTNTPTLTPTPTITNTPTPTPTTTVGCNQSCTTNSNCSGELICSSGYCRNADCTAETDCNCPGPTSTPTPTLTNTPTPTTTPGVTSTPTPTTTPTQIAQVTPTPSIALPEAGFVLPTFGAIVAGFLLVVVSLAFLL